MSSTRAGGFAGITFVALSIVWALLMVAADRPGYDSSTAAISEYWADSGNRTLTLVAAVALSFAGIALLWFVGSFRADLRSAEGEPARLAPVAYAGGVVLATLMFAKNSIDGGLALALIFGEAGEGDFTLDPEAFKALDAVFLGLLVHEGVAAAVLVGAASAVILRTRMLPRWLGWSGLVVAVLAIASWVVFGLPLILVLAWILAVSVLMLRRRAFG